MGSTRAICKHCDVYVTPMPPKIRNAMLRHLPPPPPPPPCLRSFFLGVCFVSLGGAAHLVSIAAAAEMHVATFRPSLPAAAGHIHMALLQCRASARTKTAAASVARGSGGGGMGR